MDEILQNAIDTVDNARQHKCELEGRLGQLTACISQVSLTGERSKREIKQIFTELHSKITQEILNRQNFLLEEVKTIEAEALKPLEECKQILVDGIQEAVAVIDSGEKLLHTQDDPSSEADIKKLNKFSDSAIGLSLDSVPEVPSVTDVACLSFRVKENNFAHDMCSLVKVHGEICKQAPAQVTALEPLPGGMVVAWDETDSEETTEWIENGNTVMYKLQYCQGKISVVANDRIGESQSHAYFQDAYIGRNISYTVKKLLPNTVYTFRVCRCLIEGAESSKLTEDWSAWSVYQSAITTLPGYEWATVKEGYKLQDKCRVATKSSNSSQLLYSKSGGYTVGYPITFRLEGEGNTASLGDGFALVAKSDPSSPTIIKDGSLCLSADGRIFINGKESKTRFCNFCRNTKVRFMTEDISSEMGAVVQNKKGKPTLVVLRVTITVMDKEAVFNWHLPLNSFLINASNKRCLNFAAAFKSQGWKFCVF